MVRIFFLISFFLSVQSVAQTLTQSFNEPVAGEFEYGYSIDTSFYNTGMPVSMTGSNVVWDYSQLQAMMTPITYSYVSPSSVSGGMAFPGATFAQRIPGGNYTPFYRSVITPTTQTEILGVIIPSVTVNFTNTAVVAKYPMNFGTTVSDNVSGTFAGTYSGTCSGNIQTTADGLGTLNLPGGQVLSNVLRVKSVMNLTLLNVLPLGTIKQTLISYYHESSKFAVLALNYTRMGLTGGTPTITAMISGNTSFFVPVSLQEELSGIPAQFFFPNPAADIIYFAGVKGSPAEVRIYNSAGEEVLRCEHSRELAVNGLPPGIYTLEIKSGSQVTRKKLLRE